MKQIRSIGLSLAIAFFGVSCGGGQPIKAHIPGTVNRPSVASCSATPTSIFAGSDDAVAVHVNASSPDGVPLTYSYATTGGNVLGTGADVRWISIGLSPGTYSVSVRIDDGKGGVASCGMDILVQNKPNRPPTLSCSANPSSIRPGEPVTITCNASSPEGDVLTYGYSATAGQIIGGGSQVQLDSTGMGPGTYVVTAQATDSHGGVATSSLEVSISAPAPPPQATRLNYCEFSQGSSRRTHTCEAMLDDVAIRVQHDEDATLGIVGFADARVEETPEQLADARDQSITTYLTEKKQIAALRMRWFRHIVREGASEPSNFRVDFLLIPAGANLGEEQLTGEEIAAPAKVQEKTRAKNGQAVSPVMDIGERAHNIPSKMRAGEVYSIWLQIGEKHTEGGPPGRRIVYSPPPGMVVGPAETQTIDVSELPISEHMAVELKGDPDMFWISPTGLIENGAVETDIATWIWQVKPKRPGHQVKLELSIYSVKGTGAKEEKTFVSAEDTKIEVEIQPLEETKSFLWDVVKNHPEFVYASILVPLAGLIWGIWKKWRRPNRPIGFHGG
jgi:outer membrane protein OmpA-like peptidoglycan-associated protein